MRSISLRVIFCIIVTLCWVTAIPSFAQNGSRRQAASAASTTDSDSGRQMSTADIQYDPETGSLIVITDDETNDRIKTVIDSLDRPTPQVLIKVLFLEVTHGKDLDFGAEFSYKSTPEETDVHEISSFFGLANETRGGFYKVLDGNLEATVRAISNTNKLEVLSRPSILARNNQDALITVGQEVPFITNSRITSDGQTINTVQYSDIGIILRVRPRIMPGRMVEMYVTPEISNLTADTVPISNTVNARVIAKRSAETTVVVQDGKTVVIGGMMENNDTEKVSKVPLLGDIPVVKYLFRRTTRTKIKTELLIFLTPVVVDSPEDLQKASDAQNNSRVIVPKAFSKDDLDRFLDILPEKQSGPVDNEQIAPK